MAFGRLQAGAAMKPRRSPEECPVCGAEVPPNARACPSCGADERTGWDEELTRTDGLDLPGEEPEEVAPQRKRVNGIPLFWWVVGLVLLALFVRYAVFGWLR